MKYRKTKSGVEYVTREDMRREIRENPNLARAYNALKPKYELIRAVFDARIKKGVTQKELARRVGTTQSAIARFESGAVNPTLDFMSKIAAGVGAKIEIRVVR